MARLECCATGVTPELARARPGPCHTALELEDSVAALSFGQRPRCEASGEDAAATLGCELHATLMQRYANVTLGVAGTALVALLSVAMSADAASAVHEIALAT